MERLLRRGIIFVVALAMAGCKRPDSEENSRGGTGGAGRPKIFAANYPLQFFAQRISGGEIDVFFPAPKDVDPAFWQPTDEQIAAIQNCDLILLNGATYSKWAEKARLPEAKVVDTTAAFKDKLIIVQNAVTHTHGKQGEHSHEGVSCTTWIDFEQAVLQATAVRDALQKLIPKQDRTYGKNFKALKAELMNLDKRMQAVGAKLQGKPMVASHPIYQYWERRYKINLQAVLWDPAEIPSDEQFETLKKLLETHPAKWIVWEGDLANETYQKLIALGVSSVVFDPCSNVPEDGDFLRVMRRNVTNMEQVPDGTESNY